MSDDITIRNAEGTWTVRAGGAVLAETKAALELQETGQPAVIYFPRADVAMAFVDPSDTRTTSPKMGEASHFTLVTRNESIHDAAWSYEAPKDGVTEIAGYLAFYPDKVAVERI